MSKCQGGRNGRVICSASRNDPLGGNAQTGIATHPPAHPLDRQTLSAHRAPGTRLGAGSVPTKGADVPTSPTLPGGGAALGWDSPLGSGRQRPPAPSVGRSQFSFLHGQEQESSETQASQQPREGRRPAHDTGSSVQDPVADLVFPCPICFRPTRGIPISSLKPRWPPRAEALPSHLSAGSAGCLSRGPASEGALHSRPSSATQGHLPDLPPPSDPHTHRRNPEASGLSYWGLREARNSSRGFQDPFLVGLEGRSPSQQHFLKPPHPSLRTPTQASRSEVPRGTPPSPGSYSHAGSASPRSCTGQACGSPCPPCCPRRSSPASAQTPGPGSGAPSGQCGERASVSDRASLTLGP